MAVSNDRTLDLDRDSLIAWYLRNRERSRRLFDLIDPDVYYSRPIALRNPIVFYEGHLPAFSIISLINRGLGRPGIDGRLERLFARGIDPDTVDSAAPRTGASTQWPSRQEVLAFGRTPVLTLGESSLDVQDIFLAAVLVGLAFWVGGRLGAADA